MAGYNRDGGRGGRGGFGGGRGGRDEFQERKMFKTTCAECGDTCEVPFRPTGERPVYCSDCFRGMEASAPRDFERKEYPRRDREERGRRDEFQERRMYKATCSDCGSVFELPFQPDGSRPVYCSDCFITDTKPGRGDAPKKGADYAVEFEKLNAKLDKIMSVLEAAGLVKEPVVKKFIKAVKEETEVLEEVAPVKEKAKKAPKKEAVAEEEKPAKKTTKKKLA